MEYKRYILYNTINKAGANKSREVRGTLLVEILTANQGHKYKLGLKVKKIYKIYKISKKININLKTYLKLKLKPKT